MEIAEFKIPNNIKPGSRLDKKNKTFFQLLSELRKKEIPEHLIAIINEEVNKINAIGDDDAKRVKAIRRGQTKIIQLMDKELKIVPKNHFMLLWMAIGMSVFGIPVGVGMGMVLDNMGMIAIGLPIGLSMGLAIGAGMDNKAKAEGRQLDVKIEA